MMLTNVFRLEGMDEIRWYKFGYGGGGDGTRIGEDSSKGFQKGGSCLGETPPDLSRQLGKSSTSTMEVLLRAHLLLQRDGHLSSWRLLGVNLPRRQQSRAEVDGPVVELRPNLPDQILPVTPHVHQQASNQQCMAVRNLKGSTSTADEICQGGVDRGDGLFLWLFIHRASVCQDLQCPSIRAAVSDLALVDEGIWKSSESDDEVAISLFLALQNRIERALVGLSYVRFGDFFVRCKPTGGIALPPSIPLPACDLRFSVSEAGVFVQVRVCKRRVRLLSPSDLHAALADAPEPSRKSDKAAKVEVFVSPYGLRGVIAGTVSSDLVEELAKRQLLPSSDVPIGQPVVESALFPLSKPPRGVKRCQEKHHVYIEVELGHLQHGMGAAKSAHTGFALGERTPGKKCLATAQDRHVLVGKSIQEDRGTSVDGSARGGGRSSVKDNERSAATSRAEGFAAERSSAPATPLPELVDPPLGGTNIGREGWQTEGMEGIGTKSFYFENPPSSLIYPMQGILLPVWPAAPARTYLRRCWLQGWSGRRLLENVACLAGLPGWGQDFSRLHVYGEGANDRVPKQEQMKKTTEVESAGEPKTNDDDDAIEGVEDSSSSSSSSSSGRSNSSSSRATSSGDESGSENESDTNCEGDVVNVCPRTITNEHGGAIVGEEEDITGLQMQEQDNERVLDLDFVDEREGAGIGESIDMGVEEVLKSFEWDEDMNGVISDDQDDLLDFNKRKGDDLGDDFLLDFSLPTKLPRREGADAVHDNKQFSSALVAKEANGPLSLDFPDQLASSGSFEALGALDLPPMEGGGELPQGVLPWSDVPIQGEYDPSFYLLFSEYLGAPPDTGPNPLVQQPPADVNSELSGIEIDGQKGLNGETEKVPLAPTTPDSGMLLNDQGLPMSMNDPKMHEAAILCPASYRAIKIPQSMAAGISGPGGVNGSDKKFQYTPSQAVVTWMDGCTKRKGYIYSAAPPIPMGRGRKRAPRDMQSVSQVAGSGERFQRRRVGSVGQTAQIAESLRTDVVVCAVDCKGGAVLTSQEEHIKCSAEPGNICYNDKGVGPDRSLLSLEATSVRFKDGAKFPNRLNSGFTTGKGGEFEGVLRDGFFDSNDLASATDGVPLLRPPQVASEIESMIAFVRVCESARVALSERREEQEGAVVGNLGEDNDAGVPCKKYDPPSHSGKLAAREDNQAEQGVVKCGSQEQFLRNVQGAGTAAIKVEIGEWRDLGRPASSGAQEPMVSASQMLLAKQVQDGLRSRGSGNACVGLGLGLNVGAEGSAFSVTGSGTGKLDGRLGIKTPEVGIRPMASCTVDVSSMDRNQSGVADSSGSVDQKVGVIRGLAQGGQQQAGWTASGAGQGENVFGGMGSAKVVHLGGTDAVPGSVTTASPAAATATAPEKESSWWGEMVDAIPLLAQQALVAMDAGGLDGESGDGPLPQLAVRSCIDKKMSGQGGSGETSAIFIAIDELGDGADDVMPEVLEPLGAEVTPSTVATLLLTDFSNAFGKAFWEGVAQGPLSLADWCRGGLSSESVNTGDAGASSSVDQMGRGTPGGESVTGSRGVPSAASTMTWSTPEPITPPQLGSTLVSSPAGSSVSAPAGGVSNPGVIPQCGPGRGKSVAAPSIAKVGVPPQQPYLQELQELQQQQQQPTQNQDVQKHQQRNHWEIAGTGICPHQQWVLQREGQQCAAADGGQERDPTSSAVPDQRTSWPWKSSMADRRKVAQSEGEVIMLPTPPVIVGYQEDMLRTSPGTLRFWEKAPLEPYAPQKPVIYYVLCQALEPLLVATGEFFHELSSVYETCRLGTHLPAAVQLGSGMQKVGIPCPPGFVAVPVQPLRGGSNNHSVLSPPTYSSSFGAIAVMERFNKEEYRESLRKVCNCLQLSTISAAAKRDHEHDPCVVVYVVCPSSEPDVILDTTIDVCQYLAHVEWLEPMSLLGTSRGGSLLGRKSPVLVTEDMTRARKDCLPLASSSGVSSTRVAVQLLTVEVVMRCGTPCAGTLDMMKEVAFSVYTKARRRPRKFPAKFQGVSSFFFRNFQLRSHASQQKLLSSAGGCSAGMQQQPQQPHAQQQVSQHRIPVPVTVKQEHIAGTAPHSLQETHSPAQMGGLRSSSCLGGAASLWKDCGSRSGLSEERFGMNSGEASEDQGARDWSGDADWKGVVPPRRLGIAAEELSGLSAVEKATLPAQVECKGNLRLMYEPLFILAESGTSSLGLLRSAGTTGLNREPGRGNRGVLDSSEGSAAAEGSGEGGSAPWGADGMPGGQVSESSRSAAPMPNMHCCYKWTESGQWLVSVWTDVRGELLDVLVLPVEAGLMGIDDDGESTYSTQVPGAGKRNSEHRSINEKDCRKDKKKRTQQLCMLFRLLLEQGLELLAMADEAGKKKPREVVISKIGYMTSEERDGWDSAISGLGDDEGWPFNQVIPLKENTVDVASTSTNQAGVVGARHQKGRGSGMDVPASSLDQGVGHNRSQVSVSSAVASSGNTLRNRGMSGLNWGVAERQGPIGVSSPSTPNHLTMGSGRPASVVGTSAAISSGSVGTPPQDSQEKRGRLKWIQAISVVSFCVERSMQVVWASEPGCGSGANQPTPSQLRSSSSAAHAMAGVGVTPIRSLSHGAYLVVPSHSLHFLAPRAESCLGAFKEAQGKKASTAVPAASALVISCVSSSPFSNTMMKGATEEWPLNLRVSLMSHHVPGVDTLLQDLGGTKGGMRSTVSASVSRNARLRGTSMAGSSPLQDELTPGAGTANTGAGCEPGCSTILGASSMGGRGSIDGAGHASTRGAPGSGGEGEPGGVRLEQDSASTAKTEARRLVEAIAADIYTLSWLTLSPMFPNRRSVLPIHGAIAQRLARILTYMDDEYQPLKQRT